ncbi:exosome component Rrp46 [Syncephalis pseudoplumigaleata]|uniref:Exosome component Rrp46 n=1 Tax=Syncephalis pseudoplumigaleata TaxID=1712513 RepID=A0A4P9Z5I4_9FUNG|nr:exosome component Rrp46 [Syncephalis pseudoplumigaleata]|eukprot:RKP27061.1 exosome component Rrp46 [Syncephalis pseudoplumigaleata]
MSGSSRADGRTATQLRPMSASQGVLARADGAVRFGFGDALAICSVNGPMEAKLKEEQLDRATIEVQYRPATGVPGVRARVMEAAIRDIVEASVLANHHPRTLVQVTVQHLNEAGSAMATTLNAVAMALLNAGLPLRSMPATTTCAITADGELLIDPTAEEEAVAASIHTMAFVQEQHQLVYIESTGHYTEEQLAACHELCRAGADKVYAFYRVALEKKLAEEGFVVEAAA